MQTAELDALRSEVVAHKFLINAILIGLVDKKMFTNSDIDVLIGSTIASLDHYEDPVLAAAVPYLENIRISSQRLARDTHKQG